MCKKLRIKETKDQLTFTYSEKATKFCKIFTLLLTGTTQDKSKVTSLQNFVAFSDYMNFNRRYQPEFSKTIFRSDEVLSVSTSNLSGNSVPALIRHGSETSLPTNLWSQRASVSIDSEATEDDEADRRGSLVNESSPRRGSKLLDFLDKKKKDKKRYKDKQGKHASDLKACRDYC